MPTSGRNRELDGCRGVHKANVLEAFGKHFGLHPLLLEDIANTDQRPKQLLFVRRAVWPLQETINNLSLSECPFLHEPMKIFFRDVYDYVVQIVDTIETL